MSVFGFLDKITEVNKNQSLTAFFKLKGNEEFLLDHFNGFPVMPGVLLLESVKQAASELLRRSEDKPSAQYRLVGVDEIRFGQFVKPGSELKITATYLGRKADEYRFDGRIDLLDGPEASTSKKALTASLSLAAV